MVRLAAILWLGVAGAGVAQDAPPPEVQTEPPVMTAPAATPDGSLPGGGQRGADLPPLLPPSQPAPAPLSAQAPPQDLPQAPPPGMSSGSAAGLPSETDIVALVEKAHPVVQGVMALLAAAILAVLTVFLFKAVEFALVFRRLARDARDLAGLRGLADLPGQGALACAVRAATAETRGLSAGLTADLRASARERLDLSLARIEAGALRGLRSGTGILASIGSVAPFVGLFGTVFGIMNSFIAIAATQTTNLSVVAPGIAEALLATGIGLVAAIPAVLVYNRAMRRIADFRHRLADGTAEVLRRFSHHLDSLMAPPTGPARGG